MSSLSPRFRSLSVKFLLLLLAVAAISLLAAVMVRDLMIRDFRSFRAGEMEDRVYWVTADVEHAYGTAGWATAAMADNSVRALMLGLELRILDRDGVLIMDTPTALHGLNESRRQQVLSASRYTPGANPGEFVSYPLFAQAEEIGTLAVRFIPLDREALFVTRSNRLLLGSAIGIGLVALILSLVAARRLARPLQNLAGGADAIARGELGARVPEQGNNEIARLGQAFNRMAATLEQQEQLRKRLFANAAHELRTPLAAMRGELEGMIDGLFPTNQEQLRSLHEETGRLTQLVKGMEDLLQAEASALTLHRQTIELRSFLATIVERYQSLARDGEVALQVSGDTDVLVAADPDRLGQVVVNLLANALKATPPAGRITVAAAREGDLAVLTVADTGSGIAAADLPHIFERFYHNSTGGLGLGLAIVKELVAAHEGTIAVTSTPGAGTTFRVALPLSRNA